MGQMIRIPTLDRQSEFPAYRADPTCEPKAAIIVLQEIFGLNAGIRAKCDQWAEAGYLALAPELFWRISPGVELDPDLPEQLQEGFKLYAAYDQDQGIHDIEAAIRSARCATGGGKVGCVGYCLGGRLAFLVAARTSVDASVGYYGVGLDGVLDEATGITQPLMLHIPTEDEFVPASTQQAMHAALDPHPRVLLHDYPGLHHGFAVTAGGRRNEEAAQLADRRTAQFFADYL